MVAASVPRFGFIVTPNLSRCFLHRAYDALQSGKLFEAGVLLRESVRRQLYAECNWKGCLPEKATDRTSPIVLLKAQRKAGVIGKFSYGTTVEIIDTGNRAAHCAHVDAHEIRGCIAIWHTAIDNDPCGEPRERVEHCLPVTEGYDVDDCDDDDGADWWKSEGGGV